MGLPRNIARLGKIRAEVGPSGNTAYGQATAPQGVMRRVTLDDRTKRLNLGRLDLGPDAPVQLMTAIGQMNSLGSSAFADASFHVSWAAGGGQFEVQMDAGRGQALCVAANWCQIDAVIPLDIATSANFQISGAVMLGAQGGRIAPTRTISLSVNPDTLSASTAIPLFAQRMRVNRTPITADFTVTWQDNTGGTVGVETVGAGTGSDDFIIPGNAQNFLISSIAGGTFNLVFSLGL